MLRILASCHQQKYTIVQTMMSRNKINLQDSHKFSVVVNSDVNGTV